MKKILFIASALFFMQQANAQYFQHEYGNTSNGNTYEVNGQFTPVTANGTGYMVAGLHYDGSYANYNQVHVVRADDNGNISGAPYFNYRYLLYDANTGTPYTAWATSIAEVNNGGPISYVVVGILIYSYSPYEIDAFVLNIDDQGNPNYAYRYNFPGYAMKDPKCKMSINNKEILITGRCADVTGSTNTSQDAYVLDIDVSNAVPNWGSVYDIVFNGSSQDDAGVDIIENPYSGSPEVIVVGRSNIYGLMFKVDGTNGTPLAATIYKNYGINDEFTCIKTSANPLVTTNDGFIVGGNSTVNNNPYDINMWSVLMDQNGTVIWSTDHDSGNNTGEYNYCHDIMERLNTGNDYEYYLVGNIWHSATSDQDLQVIKLKYNGNAVGDFQYGTTSDNEAGESINMSNTGGMAFTGTTSANSYDQLLVNAYFNGVTACNYNLYNCPTNSTNPSTASVTINAYSYPKYDKLDMKIDKLKDNQICYATTVGSGDNSRSGVTAKKDPFNFNVISSNNNGTVSPGNMVSVHIESGADVAKEAHIIDMLGREIPCTISFNQGRVVSISAKLTNAGVYYLVLSSGSEKKSKAFIVK